MREPIIEMIRTDIISYVFSARIPLQTASIVVALHLSGHPLQPCVQVWYVLLYFAILSISASCESI